MVKVSLVNHSTGEAKEAISHAAKVCYQSDAPKMGEVIDIKGRLFDTGHHTTFQHVYCTFFIEDIAIGDITFGLHLASPFYNSSQRSGRFCGKMFANPDFDMLGNYIRNYWPEIEDDVFASVLNYIKSGISVYQGNIGKAADVAKEFIKAERPNANDKYLEQNGPKIAQEQLRIFIPVIFPTAFDFTINLSALAAMYSVSWSSPMKDVTQKMVNLVLEKWPELEFMFKRIENHSLSKVGPTGRKVTILGISLKPKLELVSSGNDAWYVSPESTDLHPIDVLHFSPWLMDNNMEEIKTDVEISVATMGQDQRHRTVRRSRPYFVGKFYLPPIPDYLGLKGRALEITEEWFSLSKKVSNTLAATISPYGAMVGYRKSASYNAVIHELSKRLCWCAQEEIYHLARSLRDQLARKKGRNFPLFSTMSPNCVLTGKCGEGVRYCGRDLKEIQNNPFPERKI